MTVNFYLSSLFFILSLLKNVFCNKLVTQSLNHYGIIRYELNHIGLVLKQKKIFALMEAMNPGCMLDGFYFKGGESKAQHQINEWLSGKQIANLHSIINYKFVNF